MQQEKNEMQKKLNEAKDLIAALQKHIEVLELALEVKDNSMELLKEAISYNLPKLAIETKWKRVYLPVYGKINAPSFSKN